MKQLLFRFTIIIISVALLPLGPIIKTVFSNSNTDTFTMLDASTQKTLTVTAKEYLIGALFAEIDMNYNIEVLKAQAVVAYTNAIFEKEKSNKDYDFEIDISREILYIDKESAKRKYEKNYEELLAKAEKAVNSVYGKIAVYNKSAVLLPYFISSNGVTEDSYIVWGQEADYLKPVKSAGDLLNPNAKTSYKFDITDVRNIIKEEYKIDLPDDVINCFVVNNRTESGTVTCCTVGSLTMTGQDFRALFGLCSANFDIACDGETLTVICYGNGHYVGMSQYGADFMARQGSNYVDILKHYYTGIEII